MLATPAIAQVVTTARDSGEAVLNAFATALATLFAFLPRLIGALIIWIVGLIVGRLVATLVTKALRAVRFDQVAERAEVGPFLRNAGVTMDAAALVGAIVKWFIYLIFLQVGATTLGFSQLTVILNEIIGFLPRIIVALFILLIGALVATLLAQVVRGSLATARLGNANVLASVARYGVLAFAIVAALSQLEIAPAIVNALWFAIIGGVVAALALAFGLGARETAGSIAAGQLIKGDIAPGASINVDGHQGVVEQVGAVYTTIRIGASVVKMPNLELARKTVQVSNDPTAQARRIA